MELSKNLEIIGGKTVSFNIENINDRWYFISSCWPHKLTVKVKFETNSSITNDETLLNKKYGDDLNYAMNNLDLTIMNNFYTRLNNDSYFFIASYRRNEFIKIKRQQKIEKIKAILNENI
jgi:hypothetical protein